jgi:hypothetical protein
MDRFKAVPQGLKPPSALGECGTAEAVPFVESFSAACLAAEGNVLSAPDPDVFPRPGPDPSPDPEPNPVPLPPPDPDPGQPFDPVPTPAPVY